ncbi:MAG: methylthioribulose 1-phosphate dehydratase [Alphaproteobacteria bacterium]|jgi:methylthioribulose-1-phosphate dehydratase|nr:methylthioribulose 1-phosphate dehydratase [Alphaproteobacteria bacterium]
MLSAYDQAAQDIINAGKFLDGRGLAPATSGNYSIRLQDGRIAITVSGRHKGKLTKADIMTVDATGKPLEDKKPSDETILHTQIYRLHPEAGAILHVHSVPGTVVTRLNPLNDIILMGNEMLKVMPGIKTHDTSISVPVVDNSQDMKELSEALEDRFRKNVPAYLIREHGFYVWGKDMAEAERIAEGLEYLLACEMETMKIKAGARS